MIVGTATIDITPEPGVELSGYLARIQPSVGIHDRLAARGLYLEDDDGERLLWLHADLIGFDRKFVQQFREAANKRFGIEPKRVILSATHTHSGPATIKLTNCGDYDETYLELLRNRLEEAAESALQNTQEAKLIAAEGICTLAVDRRRQASAHVDHRVGTLAWVRADDSYVAVLCNYAMHNVALGENNRLISADVAGTAAKTLKQRLAGGPTVLFTNGACGNINPPRVSDDFNKVSEWGNMLAESVASSLADAETWGEQRLQFNSQTFNIPLDTFDRAQIKDFGERYAALFENAEPYVRDRLRDTANRWQQTMIERAKRLEPLTEAEIELAVISFGDVSLVCVNAEIFSRITDDLREATGRRVFTVGYANGLIGYVPTAAAYEEGGYETDQAFILYGGFRPKKGGLEAIRQRAIEMI